MLDAYLSHDIFLRRLEPTYFGLLPQKGKGGGIYFERSLVVMHRCQKLCALEQKFNFIAEGDLSGLDCILPDCMQTYVLKFLLAKEKLIPRLDL